MTILKSFAVIGDGWSALASVGYLVQAGKSVTWIAGSAARVLAPLPVLERGEALQAWGELAHVYEVPAGDSMNGHFVREYRNKAFRLPSWTKAPTPEARRSVQEEFLWAPERRFFPIWESRFEKMTLGEVEEALRTALLTHPQVRRMEGVPVLAMNSLEGARTQVQLASGESLVFDAVLYADRWAGLGKIEGLPKGVSLLRGKEPCGVLQAVFSYAEPVALQAASSSEAFFGGIHRESGESLERSVFGYFLEGGKRSVWTLLLEGNEVEDNHQIGKKHRRLKQAVGRMFSGPGAQKTEENLTDAGVSLESLDTPATRAAAALAALPPEFVSLIKHTKRGATLAALAAEGGAFAGTANGAQDHSHSADESLALRGVESVSFEETLIFASGDVPEKPVTLPGVDGVWFLTDGYGPGAAFIQARRLMAQEWGIRLSVALGTETQGPGVEIVSEDPELEQSFTERSTGSAESGARSTEVVDQPEIVGV